MGAVSLVDEVAAAVLAARPEADVSAARTAGMVLVRHEGGELVVRIFSRDPEVDVSLQVETWAGQLNAEASFSNMPASVVAAAVLAALELNH